MCLSALEHRGTVGAQKVKLSRRRRGQGNLPWQVTSVATQNLHLNHQSFSISLSLGLTISRFFSKANFSTELTTSNRNLQNIIVRYIMDRESDYNQPVLLISCQLCCHSPGFLLLSIKLKFLAFMTTTVSFSEGFQ